MQIFGKLVVSGIMVCAFAGAIASIFDETSELGKQFLAGIEAIGHIFLPVAGIMAASPYLVRFICTVFLPVFRTLGADPAMAATTFLPVDMGGYQLAHALAQTHESWIMAMFTGYMAGATLVFSIPVALKILKPEDRPYLAMGVLSGFLAIPIGVFTASIITVLSHPAIREAVQTSGASGYVLSLSFLQIAKNLIPLCLISIALAIGLYKAPLKMIRGFNLFGKMLDAAIRLVFVCCVAEYFTGVFSTLFGRWGFEPIIADSEDITRALEVAGYIGIMLCGAFPMVHLLQKYAKRPMAALGRKCHLSEDASAGILAGSANALALLALVEKLQPRDKIICLSYMVCGAFLVGDHLSFTANFQPTLILPVMLGKLAGGIAAVWISQKYVIPHLMTAPMPSENLKG